MEFHLKFLIFCFLLTSTTIMCQEESGPGVEEKECRGQKGEPGIPGYDGVPGPPGDKGDWGFAGLPGRPGDKGDQGIGGLKGEKGDQGEACGPCSDDLQGMKREKSDQCFSGGSSSDSVSIRVQIFSKGDKGSAGEPGPPGLSGSHGINGMPGRDGPPGYGGSWGRSGLPGLPGIKGPPGVKGDSGAPGVPGTCGCPVYGETVAEPFDNDSTWGSIQKPANVTCKNVPHLSGDGFYYLNPGPMKVTCDAATKKTCITHASDRIVTFADWTPFWLSEKGVSVKEIYDLDIEQLTWLQSESSHANLTIRCHCLNWNPLGGDSSEAVQLLTWNDLTVGPSGTMKSPFHYYTLHDGCSSAETDAWSYTDIYLMSPIAKRLPIIDFRIFSNQNKNQALRIEIIQLCFG